MGREEHLGMILRRYCGEPSYSIKQAVEDIEALYGQRPEAPAPTCAVCGNTLGCVSCYNERLFQPPHAQNSCDNSSGPQSCPARLTWTR